MTARLRRPQREPGRVSHRAGQPGPCHPGTAITDSGVTVLTSAKGFTMYWFVPDTSTKSNCNGSCAQLWPPVQAPATAGPGIIGKLGTITLSDGSTQATHDGHPLYTYTADTAPGACQRQRHQRLRRGMARGNRVQRGRVRLQHLSQLQRRGGY